VAFSVVALTIFTYIQFQLPIDYMLLTFIFLSSITGYNFVKYAPVARLHHRSLTQQLKQIQIFSLLVFVGLFICFFFISTSIIIICSGLGLVTLFYAVPIGRKNIREMAYLKVFVIAFIWASTTYILPIINYLGGWMGLTEMKIFQFFERMLWVVLLMIPFEIRDLKFDKKYLKTLVSAMGVKHIKIFSFILLILLFIEKLYLQNTDYFWIYFCIYLSLALAIMFAKSKQKPYYSAFFVEALPIFWMLLTKIFYD
jgi:hypothetical protein